MPLKVASVLARVASPYALWAIRARVSAGFTIISLTVAPPFKRQSRQAITKCVYRVVKNLQQAFHRFCCDWFHHSGGTHQLSAVHRIVSLSANQGLQKRGSNAETPKQPACL